MSPEFREFLHELDFHFLAEGVSELDERAQREASVPRTLEPRNRLLRGVEPFCQLLLGKPTPLPQVGNLDGQLHEETLFLVGLPDSRVLQLLFEIIVKPSRAFHCRPVPALTLHVATQTSAAPPDRVHSPVQPRSS